MNIIEHIALLRGYRQSYEDGVPEVTDAEFDALEDALRAEEDALEPDEQAAFAAYFKEVGADLTGKWVKVRHALPMGSLDKAQDAADFSTWVKGLTGLRTFCVSEKLDGISIGLSYVDGQLVRAATRGDGDIGEDITRNVLKMKGVPRTVPTREDVFVRGEIILRRSVWQHLYPDKANPRNAAAGLAKREDGIGTENLEILAYEVRADSLHFRLKEDHFRWLQQAGFNNPAFAPLLDEAAVLALYDQYISTMRESLDYDIDGLVVEVDDLNESAHLGFRNNRPLGSVALKFPHAAKPTVLRRVSWSPGRNGRLTPIAHFDPVNLAGAQVQQASLHNVDQIAKLAPAGLHVGDSILVSRRNDVIPYVESLLVATDGVLLCKHDMAPDCPVCGAEAVRAGAFFECPNTTCSSRVVGSFETWVTKIGLKGWGSSVVSALVLGRQMQTLDQLYTLTEEALADVQLSGRRLGQSTAQALLAELHAKKQMTLAVFVGSLGIPLCSRSTVRTLSDRFPTLDALVGASLAELSSVPKIGAARAESLRAAFSTRMPEIRALEACVQIQAPIQGALTGIHFCLTGFRDPDLTRAIEAQGGVVKDSVGKTLAYLVAKDPKAVTGKVATAQKYGIAVIGPDDAWALVGGRP